MKDRAQLGLLCLAMCGVLALASCSAPGGGSETTDNSNQISDITVATTLDASKVYTVTGTVSVSAKLTIPAGTTIKFTTYSNYGSELVVTAAGQIDATGTPSQPIYFTSANASPAAGDWGGVTVSGNYSVFTNCTFAYAGNGGGSALKLMGSNSSVTSCTFTSNVIALDAAEAGAGTTVSANVFYGNSTGSTALWPVYVDKNVVLDNLNAFTRSDGALPNVPQGIQFYGDVTSDAVLQSTKAPYVFDGVRDVTAKLTVNPGVTVKFTTYSNYGSGLNVTGQILANGTPALRIVFTSVKDGTSVTPAMADWGGLDISGANCSFDYCTFKYSGNGNNGSTAGAAALNLYTATTTVTNSVFGYNWTCIDSAPGCSPFSGTSTDDFTSIGNNQF